MFVIKLKRLIFTDGKLGYHEDEDFISPYNTCLSVNFRKILSRKSDDVDVLSLPDKLIYFILSYKFLQKIK